MKGWPRVCAVFLALVMVVQLCVPRATGYSVMTHEELIDLAWKDSIRPLLLARFPGATEEQLREAHAYAYGGSAIQDMGYYPFGKQFFSDLTHYVRSGDFVACLLRDAKTMDELAFAIGALSHYLGDSIGHSEAVNPSTAEDFPNLEKKYGPKVTYDESPHGHIRTEFGFDVDELTNLKFAPPTYLQYIGFAVPRKFLEQAFLETYGFDIHEVLGRAHPALRSYRSSVRSFVPAFAEGEVVLHRKQFLEHPDDEAYHTFLERVKQTDYERKWKNSYQGPGFRARLVAIFIFIVPKIGAASDLAIKIPKADTEELYLRSVNHTVDRFREMLDKLRATPDAGLGLADVDLDTGVRVRREDYPLTDRTYARLLERLVSKPERTIPEELRKDILGYYATQGKKGEAVPVKIEAELGVLKGMKNGN